MDRTIQPDRQAHDTVGQATALVSPYPAIADPEVLALAQIIDILEELPKKVRRRTLVYILSRLDVSPPGELLPPGRLLSRAQFLGLEGWVC